MLENKDPDQIKQEDNSTVGSGIAVPKAGGTQTTNDAADKAASAAVKVSLPKDKAAEVASQAAGGVVGAATKLEEIELQKLQEVSTSAANAAKQAALDAGMTS